MPLFIRLIEDAPSLFRILMVFLYNAVMRSCIIMKCRPFVCKDSVRLNSRHFPEIISMVNLLNIFCYISCPEECGQLHHKNRRVNCNFITTIFSAAWRLLSRLDCNVSENCLFMMTSSNGNILRVTAPLRGEFTDRRWIPLTKASDTGLWCFLWSAPE